MLRLSALYSTKTLKKQEIQTKYTGRSPNQKKPHTIIQGEITGGEPETKATETQIIWISSSHSVYRSNSHNKYLSQHYYHTKKTKYNNAHTSQMLLANDQYPCTLHHVTYGYHIQPILYITELFTYSRGSNVNNS